MFDLIYEQNRFQTNEIGSPEGCITISVGIVGVCANIIIGKAQPE